MTDEPSVPVPQPLRKILLRRRPDGTLVMPTAKERVTAGSTAPAPQDNLVLRQLQSLRQETKVILERHVRDRELIIRLTERMEAGFDNVRGDIRELRAEVKELRSEVISLENKLLTNQNEILDIVRRLDEAESEPFEVYEVNEADGVEEALLQG